MRMGMLSRGQIILAVCFLLCAACIFSYSNRALAVDYYLDALNGKDTNPGNSASPFATFERARDAIRQLKQGNQFNAPVNVYLKGGTYYLSKPFELSEIDSGEANKPITYQAVPGENVIISGGKRITSGWNVYRLNGINIFVTNVGSLRFNSLFVNGRRAMRARTPNEDAAVPYFKVAKTDAVDNRSAFYFFAQDLNPGWQNLSDIEIVSSGQFLQSRFKIASISGNKVFFRGKTSLPYGTDYNAQDRYYVENYLYGIDAPGEWYLDDTNGNLYYYPLPGETPNSSATEFIVPVVDQLIQGGDVSQAKSYISSDFIEIPDNQDFEFGKSDFSISLWVKADINSGGGVLSKGSISGAGYSGAGYSIEISRLSFFDRAIKFNISDGIHSFNIPFKLNEKDMDKWVHFAWTVNRAGSAVTFYKDGSHVSTLNIFGLGDISNSLPLLIGSVNTTNALFSSLDEVRVFNKTLGQSEVSNLYNNNSAAENNLALCLSFEDGVFDSSDRCNHGVVYGSLEYIPGKFGTCANFSVRKQNATDYINFRNLTFSHTDWHLPKTGYRGSAVASLLTTAPAVELAVNHCAFEKNKIQHTGGVALSVYASAVSISNNEIYDIGADGIKLGNVPEERYANSNKFINTNALIRSNTIRDNIIHDIGKVHREGVGIFIPTSGDNAIAHNLIYNTGYSGICVGWWSNTNDGAYFNNNIISYNKIHSVMRDLNDGGGIYVLGKQPGTLIINNVICDIPVTANHSHNRYLFGLYFDHAEGVTAVNNVVYRIAGSGIIFFQRQEQSDYADKDNVVRNNIFVDAFSEQTYFNSYSNDTFQQNIIYCAKKPHSKLFYSNKKGIIGSSDKNLFFSAPDTTTVPFYRFYNNQNADYFYTANEAEKNRVLTLYAKIFTFEDTAFRVFEAQAEGTVPLHRFYNKTNGTHFYTADEAEKNHLINNYNRVFQYEQIACYVYPANAPGPDRMPVYRFWNKKKNNAHLYTASEGEREKIISLYPGTFAFEGIVFYARADAGFQLRDWRRVTGQDVKSLIGDPLFYNYAKDDFRLLSRSPAFTLGFQQIYTGDVGPRKQ